MKIVGHKGSAGYAVENTISSFKTAIEIGCDRAELDVRVTKDNEVVVFHDKDILTDTNQKVYINEISLSELKKIKLAQGETIPTLQEVINLCKGKIDLQIELKADETPQLVSELIIKNDIENQVCITSFKVHLLKEIKEINPKLKVGLLFRTDEIMQNIRTLTEEIPLDFLAPFSEIITKEFIEKAHGLKKTVYAYRVNDKDLANKLFAMGIDEIGTDFPKLFIIK